jgi:adenylate kinase family enzyme
LLDYYGEQGLVVEINGDQPVEDVHKALIDAIASVR